MEFGTALYQRGQAYYDGIAHRQNKKVAYLYFKRAAELGHAEAILKLAECYPNGPGIEQSDEKPISLANPVADSGQTRIEAEVAHQIENIVEPTPVEPTSPPEPVQKVRYQIHASLEEGIEEHHCISIRISADPETADHEREVPLGLRLKDNDDVTIELVSKRGRIRFEDNLLMVEVGRDTEVFFRLHGPDSTCVFLELYHHGDGLGIASVPIPESFQVKASLRRPENVPVVKKFETDPFWINTLPEGNIRKLFEHLASHGVITEIEATAILGSGTQFRRFSNNVDAYTKSLPFSVRTETIGGVKRYVKYDR